MWDPDPLINLNIEQRRTSLSIKYLKKVNQWLEKYYDTHKPDAKSGAIEKMKQVLIGTTPRLSMLLLDGLEKMASDVLDPVRIVMKIDLTNDDDEETSNQDITEHPQVVRLDCSIVSITDSPPNSPRPEDLHLDTAENAPVTIDLESQNLRKSPRTPTEPLQFSDLFNVDDIPLSPIPSSIHIHSPLSESSNLPKLPPRRKSLGGIAKEQPSIAEYKIKHQILKPPSIYAKRNEEEPNTRNIITVPYKTALRPPSKAMDPKQEAIKVAGIIDRIYVRNYLHIDVERKKKMLKERETENQDDDEDGQFEIESLKRVNLTRRKSITEKIAAKSNQRRKSLFAEKKVAKAPRQEESLHSTSIRKSILKTCRKRTAARLTSSDFEDDLYVPPDHVLEGVELEAAEVLKAVEKERMKESTIKKSRKSVVIEEKVPQKRPTAGLTLSDYEDDLYVPPDHVLEIVEMEAVMIQKAVEKEKIAESTIKTIRKSVVLDKVHPPTKPSLSEKRMTRSKSMFAEPPRLKSSGIDVLEEPVKKLPKPKAVTKPKPVRKPKKQVAKKRGRPALGTQTNIVSQAVCEALKLPDNVIFSPPQKNHLTDFIDSPEEGLLIEIYGIKPAKTPKRKTQLRPRFQRRMAVDEPPLNLVPIEIKIEVPEES